MNNITVGVVQMVSGMDVNRNVLTMQRLVREAVAQGAEWVALPEYWPIMGKQDTDKVALAEPFGQGALQQAMQDLARELNIVLLGGTIPLQSPEAGKVLNTMLTYGRNGELLGRYDKMHLFGFTGIGERYAEADTISHGEVVPKLIIEGIPVAQGVCYDLRFPEFFRAQLPFDVLVLPAAFTHTTGKAHWQTLLTARAIENQCFVLASAQGGIHENGRHTFGHSMMIDPWGDVVISLPEGEGVIVAELNGALLDSVRNKLPALKHRRV